MAALRNGIPIIAVRENKTVLSVNAKAMGLENVIDVNSYTEAAGIILALRNGIALRSLRRPFDAALEIRPPLEFEKELRHGGAPTPEQRKRAWGRLRSC